MPPRLACIAMPYVVMAISVHTRSIRNIRYCVSILSADLDICMTTSPTVKRPRTLTRLVVELWSSIADSSKALKRDNITCIIGSRVAGGNNGNLDGQERVAFMKNSGLIFKSKQFHYRCEIQFVLALRGKQIFVSCLCFKTRETCFTELPHDKLSDLKGRQCRLNHCMLHSPTYIYITVTFFKLLE